ncbi:MAG TPA: Stp1/IreP family PP2C-type Ser/Thr phosphatase [Gaiellaceae bacterium]|jgi:PPM family protein phosphatase|nr:Stp1/IreP family PP2C-type Ser/Thr phosphatase [Gaiellaceae bacterium]
MNIGFATHPGRKRRHNEDSYVVEPPMFAVADGMGGAKAGEVASGLAAAALREAGTDGRSGEERVTQLIQEANRRVFRRANEDRDASGMGTTMTVALVEDGRVVFGHVGDSRGYLIREGSIEQLTDDHSLVAELVRSGRLTPEEAEAHPQRSVITRAVGTEPDVDVDTFTIEPEEGDLFLICSDGLTDMVDDGTIIEAIERHRDDLDEAANALVGAANRVGGEDNITVLLVEVGAEADVADTQRAEAVEVDEDTLSGLEAVPAVDTAVVPPEEAGALAAAEPPKRRGRALPIISALAVLLIAAAAVLWLLENA